jgi:hypothetical protein
MNKEEEAKAKKDGEKTTKGAGMAAFIDGTGRCFCRPGGLDANQRTMYSRHY